MEQNPVEPFQDRKALSWSALLIGSAGSLGLTLFHGRHNHSILLVSMFGLWVLSPFLMLGWTYGKSRAWDQVSRRTLQVLIWIIPLFSCIAYSGIINPPGIKATAVFLLVPLLSWILLAICIRRAMARAGQGISDN